MKVFSRSTPVQSSEVPIAGAAMRLYPRYVRAVCYIPRDGSWEFWQKQRECMAWMEAVAHPLRQPHFSLSRHLRKYQGVRSALHSAARRVAKSPTLADYQRYVAAYVPHAEFIWTPWAITYILEPWFLDQLKRLLPTNWERVYEALAIPPRRIAMEQLQRALLQWKIDRGDHDVLTHLADRFGYLPAYSVNDPAWKAEDLRRMAGGMSEPRKELRRRRNDDEDHRRRARKSLALLSGFPPLQRMARIIHAYTWLRTDRADVFKHAMVLAQPFYRALEQRFGWQFGWAAHCTFDEICTALSFGTLPEPSEVESRAKNQYILFLERKNNRIVSTVLSDTEQWVPFLHRRVQGWQPIEGVREVRGVSAFVGQVRGRVRVILRNADVAHMEEGEILVSDMTHPDYMAAIRKAKAIVTDEGGILCHAASIARELQIPCIIATKEGSKVFKTGDVIEVDASRGIARRIGE